MELTEKTSVRLTQISLVFSLFNFFLSGINSSSIMLFIVFTLTVYSSTRIFTSINALQHSTNADMSGLSKHLVVVGILFVGIATFTYSSLFGIFYLVVGSLYLISPNDRAWLAGKKKIALINNKIEYQEI